MRMPTIHEVVLTPADKRLVVSEMRDLILMSAVDAVHLRELAEQERLFGSDDAEYEEVGTIKVEFVDDPPKELADKFDAIGSVFLTTDIQPGDRIRVGEVVYRVQAVDPVEWFGVDTHKQLSLVKIHGGNG